jgi:GDP-4-dehydro-6-deoxy-D-mannose reductase
MALKILITGANGFVAPFVAKVFRRHHKDLTLIGVGRNPVSIGWQPDIYASIDLLDRQSVFQLCQNEKPDGLIHLAAQSSVAESWKTPVESFLNNSNIFLNLLESLRSVAPVCRILSIGSSEEYGKQNPNDLPFRETLATHPQSPYAVARVAQSQMASIYHQGFGMNIVSTRSFNHCGPGQSDRFVISAIAKRLVEMALSKKNKLITGNVDITRDFLDVRDVAEAYLTLFEKGRVGEIYNICSGVGKSIKEIIDTLSHFAGVTPQLESDPKLFRPNDPLSIIGDPSKIFRDTGWKPNRPLEKTLSEMIDYWKK